MDILKRKDIINKLSFYSMFYNISKELLRTDRAGVQHFGSSFIKFIVKSVLKVLHISKNDVADYCDHFGYYFNKTKDSRYKLFRIYFDLDLNRVYTDQMFDKHRAFFRLHFTIEFICKMNKKTSDDCSYHTYICVRYIPSDYKILNNDICPSSFNKSSIDTIVVNFSTKIERCKLPYIDMEKIIKWTRYQIYRRLVCNEDGVMSIKPTMVSVDELTRFDRDYNGYYNCNQPVDQTQKQNEPLDKSICILVAALFLFIFVLSLLYDKDITDNINNRYRNTNDNVSLITNKEENY